MQAYSKKLVIPPIWVIGILCGLLKIEMNPDSG